MSTSEKKKTDSSFLSASAIRGRKHAHYTPEGYVGNKPNQTLQNNILWQYYITVR